MRIVRIAGLTLCVLWVSCASAGEVDGATIVQQGNGHGAAPCMACHGANGGGQAAAGFPRLAGLPAVYLRKQLDDFANGTRANATMQPVASALSDADRDAVAQYFSRLPAPASTPAAPLQGDAATLGQRLATRGRWSENVPACEQCHGPSGVGVGDHFPPLAGQSAVYLGNQLRAWTQASRHNDPLQLMQHVATKLSNQDIAAVSAWFAAQPDASAKESTP